MYSFVVYFFRTITLRQFASLRQQFTAIYTVAILLSIVMITGACIAQPYPEYNIYDTDLLPPSFFKANRERLLQTLGDSALVILYSAGEHTYTTDVEYPYRQNDDFFYFTGCNEPNSILLLSSAGFNRIDSPETAAVVHEALLVDSRDKLLEQVDGKKLGPEGALQVLGFEYALSNADLSIILPIAIASAKTIYLPAKPEETKEPLTMFLGETNAALELFRNTKRMRSPVPTIKKMREIKSPEELAIMQKAVDLTINAHRKMIESCKPGMFEYQLQAVFEFSATNAGAEALPYPCIIGSGENSVILHYDSNRKQMKDGEVVVMDCGIQYHNYASDLTRTIPVNGTFTKEQREIYEIVLSAQSAAMKEMKPGVTYTKEPSRKAEEVIRNGLLRLGIIKDSLDWQLFYPHALGHPIGLSAHDVITDWVLRKNQVWTVEPGIYIPANSAGVDPKYWNIGIRIEDEVVITENGISVLSIALPKTPDEIEAMMK